jgi:HAD superfamily hydrolase (TIGR01509 family)
MEEGFASIQDAVYLKRSVRAEMTRSAPVDAIAFDLDGVLIDSEPIWDAVRRELTEAWGGHWHDSAHQEMMGMSAPEWSRYMHERLALPQPPEEINQEVVRRVAEHYERNVPLLPSAVECVQRLAREWPLAVASSSNRSLIEAVLRIAKLRDCFRVVLSSEEVVNGKPQPDVYLEAARRLGIQASHCAAVEDSENGILAAKAAGMRVIAVPNRHYPPSSSSLQTAEAVLSSLHDLTPAFVRGLF